LSEVPHHEQWRVWITAWPLIAIAGIAAVLITRRIAGADQGPMRPRQTRRAAPIVFTVVLWMLSIAVPGVLFFTSLRTTRSLVRFWDLAWQPFLASGLVALLVAAAAMVILLSVWIATSSPASSRNSARLAIFATVLLLAAGLTPGILVGAATARAWSLAEAFLPAAKAVHDSSAVVVIAHIARFGFLPALAGLYLAASEPRDLQALRLLDCGTRAADFARAAIRPQIGVVLAISLATGLLSLHEIEAAVLLQPPSAAGGGMPWQMLQWLHFARMEDLSAAVLWMLWIGLAVLCTGWAVARIGRGGGRRSV
jgi:ABC-type Fe3+ transport system permease subunit